MARAQKRKWIDLVAGLLVAAATQPLALLAGPDTGFAPLLAPGDGAERVVAQLGGGASRARMMLNSAIDAERRGDLDKAAAYYREAQAQAYNLPPDDRRELERRVAANAAAIQARREAREQIAQAESALQHGRPADAAALVKKITANELYLNAADKQRFQMVCQGLHVPAAAAPAAGGNAVELAHRKVAQARAALARADLDAAETLTHEADLLHVNFAPQEDSPRRLSEDLVKARKDGKTLLQASRAALQRGSWDRAEQYARAAEQQASPFTFMMGDSPTKVLKEIHKARNQASMNGNAMNKQTETPAAPPSGVDVAQTAGAEKARALVQQGREALNRGDVAQARKCAEQASALHANLPWFQDNPARLLEDVSRAASKAPAAAAPATAGNSIKTKEEAIAVLKQGREQLAQGDLDTAYKTAARLREARHLHWGLFTLDDTPDKFQADVERARLKHNRDESVKLLAEARRRFEQRDYDTAEKLAYEAQSKHGKYNILDFGDCPSKLLADVQAARQKERPQKLPAPPTASREVADLSHGPLAQPGNPAGAARTPPGQQPNAVAPASFNASSAQAGPRPSADGQGVIVSRNDKSSPPLPDGRGPDRAPAQLAAATPQIPPASRPTPALPDKAAAEMRARQLVTEARTLQRQNRLLEARDKVVEAQRLGVSFRPDEDSPGLVSQQLASLAQQQINGLVHRAGDTLRYGTQAPPQRCRDAERDLAQARQLAVAFGQDLQPIEATLMLANQVRNGGNPAGPAAQATAMLPPSTIDRSGHPMGNPAAVQPDAATQLLDKARLELRSGETANARRLVHEAIRLGAGATALTVLRSIDAEENAQLRRRANTAFDAVVRAYYRRDYRQARLMLTQIDTKQLDERRQGRLREILNTPEMRSNAGDAAIALTSGQQTKSDVQPQLGGSEGPELRTNDAGHAHASDDPGQSLLAHTRAMRDIKLQQLRQDCMKVQTEALQRFRAGQTDSAMEMLQEFLNRLADEQLDPGLLAPLRRQTESRMQALNLLKAQAEMVNNRFDARSRETKRNLLQAKNAEDVKQGNVARLMKRYNDLFREAKYAEAEMVALQVHDLDPDNPMATAAMSIAKLHRRHDAYGKNRDNTEDYFLNAMNDTSNVGSPEAIDNGIAFTKDKDRLETIRRRKALDSLSLTPHRSAAERNIERKLLQSATLSYVNTPLQQIVSDVRGEYGINIVLDEPSLAEKGIGLDSPLSIQLDNIALKSGLKLLLEKVHLTYVIADDVLKITTEEQARGRLTPRVYQVTDLVIAVENFNPAAMSPLEQTGLQMLNQSFNATAPMTQMTGMQGGQPVGAPAGSAQAPPGSFASEPGGNGNVQVTKQRPQTHEDMLIKLITSTIAPSSWADQGGPGTIDFHPLTMALVINQTPDIQDQVQDLLNALRRLIDQEVAVEVKFISIAEDFFERIGVNFNMNILNKNREALQYQPELTSGQFAAPGYINFFAPKNFISGLTPAGTLTNDLNIPIINSTYPQAVPPFGGYPGVPGYGGLTLGLAFLSDIQVFLFMEAVQGDTRTNVMQAPKLTLFNGQTALITVGDFQFFTLGVSISNGGFGQLIYNPVVGLAPLTTTLTIQAVISGDRRFVRLSLAPSMHNIVNGEVQLFPVVTPIFPLFDGTATGQPVVFTQFVQQPRLTSVVVMTTVAVPDGGTVLMGGLKRLSEGRNEFGPPVISKIPYLNRLFRNVGYGRSAESLLIMVTPRIIIQAEEEEKQTGYTPPPAVAAP